MFAQYWSCWRWLKLKVSDAISYQGVSATDPADLEYLHALARNPGRCERLSLSRPSQLGKLARIVRTSNDLWSLQRAYKLLSEGDINIYFPRIPYSRLDYVL
jgi:hypothetical protein